MISLETLAFEVTISLDRCVSTESWLKDTSEHQSSGVCLQVRPRPLEHWRAYFAHLDQHGLLGVCSPHPLPPQHSDHLHHTLLSLLLCMSLGVSRTLSDYRDFLDGSPRLRIHVCLILQV